MDYYNRMNSYKRSQFGGSTMRTSGGAIKGRLMMGLLFAAFTIGSYFFSGEHNEITGKTQYVSMNVNQEIALGLQAVPEMVQQYGGLSDDARKQGILDEVGQRLIQNTVVRNTEWNYEFHLLADNQTVNAFALPGGQIFITQALYDKLPTEDHLAGVIGHEIGHVVARHGAQQMAKQQLTQGLTGAAVMASGDQRVGQMGMMIGNMVNMKYGRGDELESDALGVRLMHEAGYDPHALIGVMDVLEAASGGRSGDAEFFSTHPNPENRRQRIKEAIAQLQI
jgi:beta-barrel assembly-enhancing protease